MTITSLIFQYATQDEAYAVSHACAPNDIVSIIVWGSFIFANLSFFLLLMFIGDRDRNGKRTFFKRLLFTFLPLAFIFLIAHYLIQPHTERKCDLSKRHALSAIAGRITPDGMLPLQSNHKLWASNKKADPSSDQIKKDAQKVRELASRPIP